MKKDWEIKKLGEVLVKTETVDPTKHPEIEFAYLDVSSVNKETKEIETPMVLLGKEAPSRAKKLVKTGDVIFATVRPTHSRVALVPEEFNEQICSTGYFVLRTNETIVNKLIFYFLLTDSFNKKIEKMQRGANYPAVTDNDIKGIGIPFPKSLTEQHRIVSLLDKCFIAIDKAKANAEQNLRNAKELFESYFQAVFEKKDCGWEEKKLGELATFRNGMNFTKSSKGEKIKIVGVKDFQDNFWIPSDELDTVAIDGKLSKIDELEKDDLVAVRSNGNPALIGRTLLAGKVEEKTSHSGFTIRIRLSSNEVLPIYLCRYLKTQKTRKQLVETGIGVGIKSLNQGSLCSLSIPFPKSLKEQQVIVRQLDVLRAETQKLEGVYQKKIASLEELKKSVLQKAFSGELTEKGGVV